MGKKVILIVGSIVIALFLPLIRLMDQMGEPGKDQQSAAE